MENPSAPANELKELRLPPFSKEAEDSILGALLVDNSALDIISDKINANDFYDYGNRLIFEHILKLVENDHPADVITVADSLKEMNQEKETGGIEYLNRLADYSPGSANLIRYAEILRDRSIRRKLISVGSEISAQAFTPEGLQAEDLLDQAEAKVLAISEDLERSSGDFISLGAALKTLEEQLKELMENPVPEGQFRGIRTGFADLDKMTDGMHDGELIIVAGRPAMGKTAFALNVALQVALDGLPVGIFSLEMGADQLANRMISCLAEIPQDNLKTGRLDADQWGRFYNGVQTMKDLNLLIDQGNDLSVMNIRSRARKLKSRYGKLGLIVIDYLQLASATSGGVMSENRAVEVSAISRGLKALARELGVPVMALSQLNRDLEKREDKRPMMSDLRESGAIEQDADLILFLYRDCVYNKVEGNERDAELIIGKQRSGPTGTIGMIFEGEFTRFKSKAYGYQEEYQPQD
ncbi:replicative DNA helicase [Turicimonas muris]|uniref:replicative DNA helicase n=1 Tax=Turicimonas muris TaxID=1796652 RepID=UPI0025AF54AE|nr:replicative DNA helicase [Turicimonas muris]